MPDGKTELIALLGHPVKHSLSPAIHNRSFELLNLNYTYLAFDIMPDQLADAMNALRLFNMRGVNLTMPLKESVIPLLDKLSPASKLSGSVNTIVNDSGFLTGHTTDGAGYIRALARRGFDIEGKTITLLGAGGAAKAILVQAALDRAARINVFKRQNASFPAFRDFCDGISSVTGCDIVLYDINDTDALRSSTETSQLLTNATNVGMGQDQSTPIDTSLLHPDIFVTDIIYDPPMTTLLKAAKDRRCNIMGGKDMLLFQAAVAFNIWTGKEMPTDDIINYINI